MGLFFDVLSSINNPDQNGSIAQLENLTNTVQNLAKTQGVDPAQMQSVLATAGGLLGPLLQQQQSNLPGGANLGNLLNQITGTGAPATALQSLFPPQVQQQLIQGIAQKTGVNSGAIQAMLPTLLPAVMGLLNMGGGKAAGATNPLLSAFMGGGNDLGEVFKFANRFLNPA
ncbi:MAG: DUF937 domain-containing protein [Leptolyngbyaceae cyanobacterium bins.349]|nr:DUF937 domain-containing protein [Leptolyngbyaceae cyanobacterium bins.349]